jgi:hypothetical protein
MHRLMFQTFPETSDVPKQRLSKPHLEAIRRLDVEWALENFPDVAENDTLRQLHLARLKVGTKGQQKESRDWLKRNT